MSESRDAAATPPESGASGVGSDSDSVARSLEKIRILERHCDHLMGQLYHQVGTIKAFRDQVAHLQEQIASIQDCPKLLDQALQKIAHLKEDSAGRKEVELDLRRRIDELEREEQVKSKHIKRLEGILERFWQSPPRRVARAVKNAIRGALGRPPPAAPMDPDGDEN